MRDVHVHWQLPAALILSWCHAPAAVGQIVTTPKTAQIAPVTGENTVSGLRAQVDSQGQWVASFDYFYSGEPRPVLYCVQAVSTRADTDAKVVGTDPFRQCNGIVVKPGRHHVETVLLRKHSVAAYTTDRVVANLISMAPQTGQPGTMAAQVVASQDVAAQINWPDQASWEVDSEVRAKPAKEILDRAVRLIDVGGDSELELARRLLERLLVKDARLSAAYIELARVAMKTNWGPEGLHQAEGLIASALEIAPQDPNAQILLGYVYSHQKRYKAAETQFVLAAKSNTKNLWLWFNWGELLLAQGRTDAAVQMFRKSVDQPPPRDTYDRAREAAYDQLIGLLAKRNDLDGLDKLHRQRIEDYGTKACYVGSYAAFLLLGRGDASNAITVAQRDPQSECAKHAMGMAYYVLWAGASSAEQGSLLNRARVYFPGSAALMYRLATSDYTVNAAKKLLQAGEVVDQQDNRGMSALARALEEKDYAAAQRLLRLGAKPEKPMGAEGPPVAMLPILGRDSDGVRLLQQYGVNYAKLSYRGASALEVAKQLRDKPTIELLSKARKSL